MKCLILAMVVVVSILAGQGWGATVELCNVDFLTAEFYGGDSTYLYGFTGARVVKRTALGVQTNGKLVTDIDAGYSISSLFTTGTDGLIFLVVSKDSKYYLLKSIDGGANFGNNNPAYDDGDFVLMFGDTDGTVANQIANVQVLGVRSFCAASIGGSDVYLCGEYNVNASRTAGGTNDQVRLMKSTDGNTWTEVTHWNTDGSHRNTRHIHVVRQDASTGNIYIGFGDSDDESGMIRWDGTSEFPANQDISTYTTGTLESISGGQKYRPGDIVFLGEYMYVSSDTISEGDTGIWRAAKDFTSYTNMDDSVTEYDSQWAMFGGLVTAAQNIIFTTFMENGFTDAQCRVWTSSDGITWNSDHIVGWRSDNAGYARALFEWGGYIYLAANDLATGAGTVVFDEAVCNTTDKVLHPVYYVSTAGNNANDGRSIAEAWQTLEYAMEGDAICRGACVLMAAGDYTESAILCDWDTSYGTTGSTIVEGVGSVVIHGDTATLWASGDDVAEGPIVFRNLQIYTDSATANAKAVQIGDATDAALTAYNCVIGKATAEGDYGVRLYDNGSLTARYCVFSGQARSVWLSASSGAVFDASSCLFIGCPLAIYQDNANTVTLNNCTFSGQTTMGVTIDAGTTIVPTIKNCVFVPSGAGGSVRDYAGITETDSKIDYNCYSSAPVGLANSGGSHSVTSDPLFVSASTGDFRLKKGSPCIDAGTNLGATYDDDYLGYDQDKYGLGWEIGAYVKRPLFIFHK